MAYGLRIINDENELLVDSNYTSPAFIQKVEFEATPYSVEAGTSTLHSGYLKTEYRTPVLSFPNNFPGNMVVMWALPDNGSADVWYNFENSTISMQGQLVCYVYANSMSTQALSYYLPTAYIFFLTNIPDTQGYGLRLYNEYGIKTFDSNNVQLVPYTISDSFSFWDDPSGTLHLPSSITLDMPASPIFMLPNYTDLRIWKEPASHLEFVYEPGFRRQGNALQAYEFQVYYSDEDSAWESNTTVYRSGNRNGLGVIVADTALYGAPNPEMGGGTNPTYLLTSSVSPANETNEGTTITVTLNTTLVPNNSVFPYTVTGISAADLTAGSLTGSFVINSNTASVTFTFKNDESTEGTEIFKLSLDNMTQTVEINIDILDTSKSPPIYQFSTPSPINEGSTGYNTFSATNAKNKVITFGIIAPLNGTTVDGLDGTLDTTTWTVPSDATSSINVYYTANADGKTEGAEYFRLNAIVNGLSVATSGDITVNDLSMTAGYSISAANNWTENSTNSVTITATNAPPGTLYLTTSDVVVTPSELSVQVTGTSFSQNVDFVASNVDANTPVTLHVRTGSANGTIVASKNITVTNTAAVYGFAAAVPINEGSSASNVFSFSGAANKAVYFNIIGPSAGYTNGADDVNLVTTVHTISSDSPGTVSVNYNVPADNTTEGEQGFRITATVDGVVVATTGTIIINDTSLSASYSITVQGAPWNEDSFQSTEFTAQNAQGKLLQLSSSNSSLISPDTELFYIDSNNYSAITIWTVGSVTTDTTVTIRLKDYYSQAVLASTSVIIKAVLPYGTAIGSPFCVANGVAPYTLRQVRADGQGGTYNDDTNNSPTCGYVTPSWTLTISPTSINETTSNSFTITLTTNQSGSFPYTITGVDTYDIGGASLTGSLSNNGTRTINVSADSSTEGNEIFIVSLDNGQASANVTINDTSQAVLSIVQSGDSSGSIGTSFSSQITLTSNGSSVPAIWSYSGSIPPGLSISLFGNSFGSYYQGYSITGTPTTAGTYSFTVNATASSGGSTSRSFSISIAYPAAGTPSGGQYCGSGANQYTLYQNYHDGSGGTYASVVEYNSATCGYVAPSYAIYNTWSSLANGSSGSFYLRSFYANGVGVSVYASGAGASRVSINPSSFTIGSNSQTDTYITVTATSPTSAVPEQSVTINVSTGQSFSFTLPAFNPATAPLVSSVTYPSTTVYRGEDVLAIINFDGPITADTYVRVEVNAGVYGTGNNVFVGGSPELPIGSYTGNYTTVANPGYYTTTLKVGARAETSGGSIRQNYIYGPTVTLSTSFPP